MLSSLDSDHLASKAVSLCSEKLKWFAEGPQQVNSSVFNNTGLWLQTPPTLIAGDGPSVTPQTQFVSPC